MAIITFIKKYWILILGFIGIGIIATEIIPITKVIPEVNVKKLDAEIEVKAEVDKKAIAETTNQTIASINAQTDAEVKHSLSIDAQLKISDAKDEAVRNILGDLQ